MQSSYTQINESTQSELILIIDQLAIVQTIRDELLNKQLNGASTNSNTEKEIEQLDIEIQKLETQKKYLESTHMKLSQKSKKELDQIKKELNQRHAISVEIDDFYDFNEKDKSTPGVIIQTPRSDDSNITLKHYSEIQDKYLKYAIEEGKIKHYICEHTNETKNLELKINELLTSTSSYISTHEKFTPLPDLKLIEYALTIIDFIIENKAIISGQYFVVADLLSVALMFIHKITDVVKDRNLHIAPESGWWLFDLLAKLSINDFKPDQSIAEQLKTYETLKHFMLPKIICEDLVEIQKLLQQMYDTEAEIMKTPTSCKKYPLFNCNWEFLSKIVDLQIKIENGIRTCSDIKIFEIELNEIVTQNKLKSYVEHTQFFCATVNNYYSLKKLITIIDQSKAIKKLSRRKAKQALLFVLIQLGEYMTHKKLSNKFREVYPGIPWEAFQLIRDCLEHLEENGRNNVVDNLLAGTNQAEEFFKKVLEELGLLQNALTNILELEYSDPNKKFMTAYFLKYETNATEEENLITQNEIKFFIEQLNKTDKELVNQWQAILENREILPTNKQLLAKLTTLLPKGVDLNKESRLKCESLINKLGDISKLLTEDEKKYLWENLEIKNENKEKVKKIIEQIGQVIITKAEKNILRENLPKKQLGQDEENIKKCHLIVNKLEDIRDRGECILYPSERKQFENTRLYKESTIIGENEVIILIWKAIILKQRLPSIVELQSLEDSENMIDKNTIIKIQKYAYSGLQERWLQKLNRNELNNFINILDEIENKLHLKWKWLKILNSEIDYPDVNSFAVDMKNISLISKEHAKCFVKITNKLKPIKIELPAIRMLENKFKSSDKVKLTRKELINIAGTCLQEIDSLTKSHVHDKEFLLQTIKELIMPEIGSFADEFRKNDPNYQKFLEKRNSIMQEIQLKSMLTGKAIEVPIAYIRKLHKEMCGNEKPSDDRNFQQNFVPVLLKKTQEAYAIQYEKKLPELIENDYVFKNAVIYNLTISLALLKKITKFPESHIADFLYNNYVELKRARNELTHGNYIRESLDKDDSNKIIEDLIKISSYILKDFKKIKACINEAWPKAWAQVSIAMMLQKAGKVSLFKPAVNNLVSKITNNAFPNSVTSSEQNGIFNDKSGFAYKFFHKHDDKASKFENITILSILNDYQKAI